MKKLSRVCGYAGKPVSGKERADGFPITCLPALLPTFLCALCFLLCNLPALALDRITATIVVTNTPADGNTLVINGNTRTWKTTVATVSTQIGITNTIGAHATNLFNHVAAYPHAGSLLLSRTGTNGITLSALLSGSMAASLTGTWGSITLSTQTVPVLQAVRVPFSSLPLPASDRTNHASHLVTAIDLYSTNTFSPAAAALANYVNNAGTQTGLAGNKTWTGTHSFGMISNTVLGSVTIGGASTFSGISSFTTNDTMVAVGAAFHTIGRGTIKHDSDGVLLLQNEGATGFTAILFGGGTASFPKLQRSGAGFLMRLADDSAPASVGLGPLTIGGGTAIAKVMSATAVLDFPNTTNLLSADLTITVTGAADADVVDIGVPAGSVNANSCFTAWVSAANTVTVRFNNYSAAAINPASGTFRAMVTHF